MQRLRRLPFRLDRLAVFLGLAAVGHGFHASRRCTGFFLRRSRSRRHQASSQNRSRLAIRSPPVASRCACPFDGWRIRLIARRFDLPDFPERERHEIDLFAAGSAAGGPCIERPCAIARLRACRRAGRYRALRCCTCLPFRFRRLSRKRRNARAGASVPQCLARGQRCSEQTGHACGTHADADVRYRIACRCIACRPRQSSSRPSNRPRC